MTYWIRGLSTRGSISFGWAFVAGRNRVPKPAAGKTAFAMRIFSRYLSSKLVSSRVIQSLFQCGTNAFCRRNAWQQEDSHPPILEESCHRAHMDRFHMTSKQIG